MLVSLLDLSESGPDAHVDCVLATRSHISSHLGRCVEPVLAWRWSAFHTLFVGAELLTLDVDLIALTPTFLPAL